MTQAQIIYQNERRELYSNENIEEMVLQAARILDDKKANDIIIMDVRELTPFTDYFIICSGNSYVQNKMLYHSVDEEMFLLYNHKRINSQEIFEENPWLLLDFGFLVVHIFMDEKRKFYNLEKLWVDAKIVELPENNKPK